MYVSLTEHIDFARTFFPRLCLPISLSIQTPPNMYHHVWLGYTQLIKVSYLDHYNDDKIL